MDEGRVEARREDIRQILEVRFGAEAAEKHKRALSRITAADELSRLHRLAISCRELSEFRSAWRTKK